MLHFHNNFWTAQIWKLSKDDALKSDAVFMNQELKADFKNLFSFGLNPQEQDKTDLF